MFTIAADHERPSPPRRAACLRHEERMGVDLRVRPRGLVRPDAKHGHGRSHNRIGVAQGLENRRLANNV